ncbi:MAG: cyclic nucleotide-binding domain-containing protein [Nitrospirae bacterium]|nr:cyclic nucleotide-binding domain-containing protein [Nitrospirota bacterium]MBF0536023.1 cyclic nucleotide-binding domain-containing protein [Nitrospirota bacterium]MBF0617911.1 cyclic nucleotide-binding domain-containing protein [Nitrospirota bacterium]
MDKSNFSYLMRRLYEEIKAADVDEAYETFMLIMDLVFIDKNVPRFFQELLDKNALRMFDDISLVKFNAKDVISKEGDRDDSMFIIVSGTVRISKKKVKAKGPLIPMPPVLLNHLITSMISGSSKTLSSLSVGDFFGESALFSAKPMAVSAIAETDVEVMVITGKSLQKAMSVKPNLRSLLREYYVSRLDSMLESLQKEQSMVQACAFGTLLGTVMPDESNYSDSSMIMSADSGTGESRQVVEASFSLKSRSGVEVGLDKVKALYAANRKGDAALLYLRLYSLFFKDFTAVATEAFTNKVLNNPKVKNIKLLSDVLDKVQTIIIPAAIHTELEVVDEQDYHGNFLALFNDLLKRKLDKAKQLNFKQDQIIVKYGDKSDSIYVVRSGSVKVYPLGVMPEGGEDESKVIEIGKGEIFGEFAFFTKKTRTATVIAAEDTSIYELKRPLVTEIVKEYPEVLEFFKKTYQSGINNLIKEADAIKAYYQNDLAS